MKRGAAIVGALLALAVAVGVVVMQGTVKPAPQAPPTPTPAAGASAASPGGTCPVDTWTHTYNPLRFRILVACVTVLGVVEIIRQEADGDAHILVRLDPGQRPPFATGCDGTGNPCSDWINATNISAQHGDLVVEPECIFSVTQADAKDACRGFQGPPPPTRGAHVAITGPWVLDGQHGWLEIHPAVTFVQV